MPDDVRAQLTKLASISLCSNVVGQFAAGLMVKPPQEGEASFTTYAAERAGILASMFSRAKLIAEALNKLPGLSCNAAEGAMYLFPRIHLPAKAIAAAEAEGMVADEWYCIRLLEATGLVVVPGSGFGQEDGSFHFRTTFLPQKDDLEVGCLPLTPPRRVHTVTPSARECTWRSLLPALPTQCTDTDTPCAACECCRWFCPSSPISKPSS